MTKSKTQEPCWSFTFYQNPDDPKLFTAIYTHRGEVKFEVVDQAYNVCAAPMERKLRMAPWEKDVAKIAVA